MNTSNTLFEKHQATLHAALQALGSRTYYSPYPENPRAYAEDGDAKAKTWISAVMNNNYTALDQTGANGWLGEEVSPFLQTGIGVQYPNFTPEALIANAIPAQSAWSKTVI
jgi:hypothetical protein